VSSDGHHATASVPSGASTGRNEAHELRDGDAARYGGAGVLGAIGAVNGELRELLCSRRWNGLADIDAAMLAQDGTQNRSRGGSYSIYKHPSPR
jgi:enolase